MSDGIVAKYKARLHELTSAELIEELTERAAEAVRAGHSPDIEKVIVQRIEMPLPAGQKLLLLYLIDSIIRCQTVTLYRHHFIKNIIYIFNLVFEEADKKTRLLMYELRKKWTPIIPGQKLSTLDDVVKKMDPKWPCPVNAEPRDELIQHHCEQKQNEGDPAKAGKGTTPIAELEADETYKKNKRILHYLASSITPDMSANYAALQKHNLFMEPEVVYRETIELLFGKFRLTELLKQELKRAIDFLYAFTVEHFFVLHACIPGYKRNPVAMLQPGKTRESAKRWYGDTLRDLGFTAVGESCFFKISKERMSSDEMDRPMTKQCSECHANLGNLRSPELTPEEKINTLLEHQMQHLDMCTQGRQHYATLVEEAKATIKDAKISELSQSKANTSDMKMHYSFDFAQKVQYPKEAKQKRTCEIFGVCCEGIPQQINYLIDEGVYEKNINANLVVSLLNHFFDTYGLGEKIVHLHCDNSGAQNKNNAMLRYLAWRVKEGKHEEISLNFMPAAHSKFDPDLNFLHVKQRLEKKAVHSVDEIAREVEASGMGNINRAHVVTNDEQSRIIMDGEWVPTKRLPRFDGMNKYHHFYFSSSFLGKVRCRKKLNSQFLLIDLLELGNCKSPAQQGWSKFRDSHPDDFALERERRKSVDEVRRSSIVADEVRRASLAAAGVSGPRHETFAGLQDVDFRKKGPVRPGLLPPPKEAGEDEKDIPHALALENQRRTRRGPDSEEDFRYAHGDAHYKHRPSGRRGDVDLRRAGPERRYTGSDDDRDLRRHGREEEGGHFASPRADFDNLDSPRADFDDNVSPRRDFDAHRRSKQEYLWREGPRQGPMQGFPSSKRHRDFDSRDSQPLFDGPTGGYTPKCPRLITKTQIGQDGPRPGDPGPRMAGPRPFGTRGPASNVARPVKVGEPKIIPGSPMGAKPSVASPAADGEAAPSTEQPAVKTEPVDASDVKSAEGEMETKRAFKATTATGQQPWRSIPQQNQPAPSIISGLCYQSDLNPEMMAMQQAFLPGSTNSFMMQGLHSMIGQVQIPQGPDPHQGFPGMPSQHFVGAPSMQRPMRSCMPMSTSTLPMCANSTPMSDNNMTMSANSMSMSACNMPISSNNMPMFDNNMPMPTYSKPLSDNSMPNMQATASTSVSAPATTPTPNPTPSAKVHTPNHAAQADIPDFNELVQKLVKIGIIGNTAKTEEMTAPPAPIAPSIEIKALEGEIALEPPPGLSDFQSAKLKTQYSGVVHNLYKGIQCQSCGCRFLEEEIEQYRQHLDLHFRLNKRKKEAAKISSYREWYLDLYDRNRMRPPTLTEELLLQETGH